MAKNPVATSAFTANNLYLNPSLKAGRGFLWIAHMFITFEGPDGSGKTTQMGLLADFLTQQGYMLFRTREPGGTPISEKIRDLLHDNKNTEMDPRAEILLYSASRAQLVSEKINPALQRGEIVLCDRFFDSTFAYQGYGHGLDLETLRSITTFAT